jgi:hypothetical protein
MRHFVRPGAMPSGLAATDGWWPHYVAFPVGEAPVIVARRAWTVKLLWDEKVLTI